MNYFIQRQDQRFGPYTESDLRRFYASGHIAPSDLVSSEANPELRTARAVLGPVATATIPAGAYLPAYQVPQMANGAPLPPNLHWGLVLLFSIVTCGFFPLFWILMQAWWVRQLRPGNRAIWLIVTSVCINYGAAMILSFVGSFADALPGGVEENLVLFGVTFASSVVVSLVGLGFYVAGELAMREGMLEYFNTVEDIHLELNPVLTVFFALFYLQYHMTRIVEWKKTGVLT